MSQHKPQPARFEVFTELKDRSGFTISGTDFVFKFDKHGGWYDEYRNYYDSNGSPRDSPQEDNLSDDYQSRSDHSDNEGDEFQREFGGPSKYYEEDDEDTSNYKFLERIASNLQNLSMYPANQMIRVSFRNIHYFCKKQEIFNYFKNKVHGLVNVVFFQNEKNQFNGSGFFIVDGLKSAESLIKLQGEKISDREVSFSLENVEDFLIDPIKEHQKVTNLSQKPKKSYTSNNNNQAPTINQYFNANLPKHVDVQESPKKIQVKVEQKKEKKQVKSQVSQVKQQIKPVKVQVKQQQNNQQFLSYKFKKEAFPKKSSFKQWMLQNQVDQNDYKNVEKIESDLTYAKITMKRKIYKQLNNKFYNGNKIQFILL